MYSVNLVTISELPLPETYGKLIGSSQDLGMATGNMPHCSRQPFALMIES
jgi:hypothetical protein